MAPNPDSRVMLSEVRDRLGIPRVKLDWRLGELERRAILAALERKKGNVKEAAASLGIDRSTLYDKLKRYEIPH